MCDDSEHPVVAIVAIQRQYALTMRRTKNPSKVTQTDYINHLTKLRSQGMDIKQYEFEESSGLHLHGVVLLPEGFNLKRLRYRGWHLLLKEIYDPEGWKAYIEKDKYKHEIKNLIAARTLLNAMQRARAASSVEAEPLISRGSAQNIDRVRNHDDNHENESR